MLVFNSRGQRAVDVLEWIDPLEDVSGDARSGCFLTLAMREAEVAEQCVTKQGITLQARAVIAFKVGNDAESIVNAAQRFYPRQKLATEVLDGSNAEMAKIVPAQANQAGPLAQAHAQQEVIAAHTELAQRQAELRQQQARSRGRKTRRC